MEGRAPHEPRAGPALRVVSATPRGDLIPSARHDHPLLLLLLRLPLLLSPRLNSALLSSTDINLGRLHLYLMLPISRLIPSPPSTAPFNHPARVFPSLSFARASPSLLAEKDPPPGGIERRVRHAGSSGSPGQPRRRVNLSSPW